MKGVIFLDRDGVIVQDVGYLNTTERIRWVPGILEALRALQRRGYALVIVSNQSGLRRGFFSWDRMWRVQREIERRLRREGIRILATYLCPHHPNERCGCRKPGTISVSRFLHQYPEYKNTPWVVVGDRETDMEFGRRMGAQTFCLNPRADDPQGTVLTDPRDLLQRLGRHVA